jgi:hypothetical protein
MKAEGDRDGVAAAGVHGHPYLHLTTSQACLVLEVVAEGEDLEQLCSLLAPAQTRDQRLRAHRVVRACQLPLQQATNHAVDRQTLAVDAHAGEISRNRHRAPSHCVLEAREPVRPGVEQRDAHRFAELRVRGHTSILREQLIATVAQRAAQHSGGRDEHCLERPLLVAQPHRIECGLRHDAAEADG